MSTSSVGNRTVIQIMREFRMYHRRVLSYLENSENVLAQQPFNEESSSILEASLEQLSSCQTRLESIISKLLDQDAADTEVNEVSEKADAISLKVVNLKGKVRAAQIKLNPELRSKGDRKSLFASTSITPNSFGMNTSLLQTKMPKLKLPDFDGDECKFLDFKNHFTKMVHENESLSPLDKLYYLKGALSGPAEKLIRDIPISDTNYLIAWKTILERYEDTFSIIESHFNTLFAIKKIQSGKEIQSLLDDLDTTLRSLDLCGESPSQWPSIISYLAYRCLDEQTRVDWKKTLTDCSKYPSWESMRIFLKTQAAAMKSSNIVTSQLKEDTYASKFTKETKFKEMKSSIFTVATRACLICGQYHLIIECEKFASMQPIQRVEKIRQSNLCFNCFNPGHSNFQCKSRKSCKVCLRKHHTLLHIEHTSAEKINPVSLVSSEPTSSFAVEEKKVSKSSEVAASLSSLQATTLNSNVVLLPSALTKFYSGKINGTLRILLDTCSQVTLISDATVKKFHLPTTKSSNPVSLAVGGVKTVTNLQCNITLCSRINDFHIDIMAEVVPSSALLYAIDNLNISHLVNSFHKYRLADPILSNPIVNIPRIDLLLGAAHLPEILCNETKSCGDCSLQNTQFGWTIMGPIKNKDIAVGLSASHSCLLSIQDIDQRLKTFWDAEELSDPPVSSQSLEHELCEKHFEKNYTRLANGQFQVRLPLKKSASALSNNRSQALRHLRQMNKSTRNSYQQFMQEYADLKHMSMVSDNSTQRYFIPYLAVLRPSSTTTKFRVVFNASSKTSSRESLNDILLVGPTTQPELFDILLQFRLHSIAFTADIAKMYRCILIHPLDRPLQSILWQEHANTNPNEYELNTITYGTASASYLATKCLEKIAESSSNPKTQNSIRSNFYMDDLLTGAETVEDARNLLNDIHTTLASAHFLLRKYQSNSAELLESIPSNLIESQLSKTICGKEAISVLGMEWIPKDDLFRIKLPAKLGVVGKLTKRTILSEIAKIFDPLVFIAPITIREKIFMQRLWRQGLTWDDIVPDQLAEEFIGFRMELPPLESLVIPRHYSIQPISAADIIGFCDASTKAYSAVVYIRVLSSTQPPVTRFVSAKTRVAPLKELTIPKLELSAALLLAKLINRISNKLKITSVFAFSDSKVVLSWLAKPANTWKVFVANRVAKIVKIIPYNPCWGYVQTSENPADLATRGLSVKTFLKSGLWLEGPEFIKLPLPLNHAEVIDPNLEIERRKIGGSCNVVAIDINYMFQCFFRFSKINRLVRSFAYVKRFSVNIKVENKFKNFNCLTAEELQHSEYFIIKCTQIHHFASDYMCLFQGKTLSKKSVLRSHNPFLDKQQVVRAATRLAHANVSYDRKCPIILPAKSHFLRLLIRHLHEKYYHATRAFIITQIRLRYIVTGGLLNAVKLEIRQCVSCCRNAAAFNRQIMGDLPKERVTIGRPFSIVGIDFAGPILCKPMTKRSKVRFKSYVAVFTCFVSRAVHLELVPTLSTEDFLNAFKRFYSRRGLPHTVYSDNGTNFKGAANHLDFQASSFQELAANERITWRFNPPYAPHRGGLWEAAVKSMKSHLIRVTHEQTFNFDELCTILTQVEAIMNSRPLAYRSSDSSEAEVLCPSHFLIGDGLFNIPEIDNSVVKLSTRYTFLRQRISSFWQSWSKDYMSQLQSREKWQVSSTSIQPSAIVLIRVMNQYPAQWPLARVLETYPDQNGVVRTVKLHSGGNEKIRACSSLILLPIDEATTSSSRGEYVGG